MSDVRPDELDRLESVTEAIASLQSLFATADPLDDVLGLVASSAAGAIPDADAVTISVLEDPGPRTAASTDDRVMPLDRAQYESGRGPCLEAAELRRPVRAALTVEEQRWPEFASVARDCGVSASLSLPLFVDRVDVESELVGSLNIYSGTATAFDPFDESLMKLYMLTAGLAIANAHRWRRSRETIGQLTDALTSRPVIDQAKGALRAIHGCSEEEAFARLVRESQNSNVKLHTIAAQFLDSLSRES
jgi:hypothetical protein